MSTRAQVALACNISERHVSRLVADGHLPRDARGVYDLGRVMASYIRFLQAAVASRSSVDSDGKITSTAAQRSELLGIDVQLQRLDLAKKLGEVISIVDHEAILSTLIIETKASLMSVGPRVSQRIVGLTSATAIQLVIDAGVKDALRTLARTVPRKLMASVRRPARRGRRKVTVA